MAKRFGKEKNNSGEKKDHQNVTLVSYLNSKNILANQLVIDQKLDCIMDNQKVLDLKLYYGMRSLLQHDKGLIKKFDKVFTAIGDVLGQLDYKNKVKGQENSRLAELDKTQPSGTDGQKAADDGSIDTDAKRENGSGENTEDS